MVAFCLKWSKTVVVIVLTKMVVVTNTDIGCDLCGYNIDGHAVGDRSGHLGVEVANNGGGDVVMVVVMRRLWWWWWWL